MSTAFAAKARSDLATASAGQCAAFDPSTLSELPPPAQRLLRRSLSPGIELATAVELTMKGEIKLGRWLPFTAQQILRAGVGFVWEPVVGGRILKFTGADVLGPDGARIEFRLHGRIPVARGSGADIERSATGRLAAETVAWLPQALTPQAGAIWRAINNDRATVALDIRGQRVDVDVCVSAHGQLQTLELQRWNDSAKPPGYIAFGGSVSHLHTTSDGVAICGDGVVGWDWATERQANGEFFRYSVTSARFFH